MTRVRSARVFEAHPDLTGLRRAAAALSVRGPEVWHAFEPHGHSLAVVGRDRHVVLHTWPEHRLVTVDVYATGAVDLHVLVTALGWRPVPGPPDGDDVPPEGQEPAP